jgi:hypothetical protein
MPSNSGVCADQLANEVSVAYSGHLIFDGILFIACYESHSNGFLGSFCRIFLMAFWLLLVKCEQNFRARNRAAINAAQT